MSFLPAILIVFLDIFALVSLWQEKPTLKRAAFWTAAILLFPALGALLYLFFFRRIPPAQP